MNESNGTTPVEWEEDYCDAECVGSLWAFWIHGILVPLVAVPGIAGTVLQLRMRPRPLRSCSRDWRHIIVAGMRLRLHVAVPSIVDNAAALRCCSAHASSSPHGGVRHCRYSSCSAHASSSPRGCSRHCRAAVVRMRPLPLVAPPGTVGIAAVVRMRTRTHVVLPGIEG
jgi:hypothetical protein